MYYCILISVFCSLSINKFLYIANLYMHQSNQHKKPCKKHCFCLRVPYVPNPTYSVQILGQNPLLQPKQCKCCCKVKQQPFNQTVVVTPYPVSSF